MKTATEINAKLTEASRTLFVKLVKDAGNWGGTPMVYLTKEERGNLTSLKRAKLLSTFRSDGIDWVAFNPLAGEVAALHGLSLSAEWMN